jgi:hypothetical protein
MEHAWLFRSAVSVGIGADFWRAASWLPPRTGEIFGGMKLCFIPQTLVRALKNDPF